MRRWIALLLLACLLLPSAAAAEEYRYPALQDTATDLAGVLDDATLRDIRTLSERMEQSFGGRLYIVTRHFLGGADAGEYAKGWFEQVGLGERDALLLLVIGEDNYALTLGSEARRLLPADVQTGLLAASFRVPYLKREYAAAVGLFAAAYGEAMGRAAGKTISTSGVFGRSSAQATAAPQTWADFSDDMDAMRQSFFRQEETQSEWKNQQTKEETKTNWRTIVIWGLVLYFLFFRKKKRNRFNFGHGPKGR